MDAEVTRIILEVVCITILLLTQRYIEKRKLYFWREIVPFIALGVYAGDGIMWLYQLDSFSQFTEAFSLSWAGLMKVLALVAVFLVGANVALGVSCFIKRRKEKGS